MTLGTATLTVELELSKMRAGMRTIESMIGSINGHFNSGLSGGIRDSVRSVGDFNSSLTRSNQGVQLLSASFSEVSKVVGSLGDGLNRALGDINFSNVLDVGKGLESFIDLERLQNSFRAIAGSSGATAAEIAKVNDQAIRLAQVTSKSPEQVAQLSIELARAGFSSKQITQSLEGVVRGSEATGKSLSAMGQIVGATLNQFQLMASDSSKVSDILAATANNSAVDVLGMGQAMKFVGTAAFNSNQSIKDTAIAIGLLGDAGIKGGMAGRNLASALQALNEVRGRLVSGDSNQKTEAFAMLGLDADDLMNAQGQMKSILELIPTFQGALENLRQTAGGTAQEAFIMQTLFGTQGGRAVSALLSQTTEDVDGLTQAVYRSQGVSLGLSEVQLEGLSGSISLLQGKFSAVSSVIGSTFAPAVKSVVDATSTMADIFLGLPAPVQHLSVGLVTLGPAAFLAAKGLGVMGVSMTAMAPQLAVAAAGIATISALMERSEGAKLAMSMSSARIELEKFYAETGKAPEEAEKVRGAIAKLKQNFTEFGIPEGARQSIAQGFQKIGSSLSETQLKALGFAGFLGGPLTGALSMVGAQMIKNTNATSDYGNAFSFLTAQQRGNQLAMLEIDKLLDVTSSRYEEYIQLMMNQSATQEEVNAKAKELIPIFEQNVAAMQSQIDAGADMTETQKLLLQAEIDRQTTAIAKMKAKANIAIETHQEEAASFSNMQQEMVADMEVAHREMIAKLKDGYQARTTQAEMSAKEEMIAIKKAYASGQLDREAHNKALADIDKKAITERQAIAESELKTLEDAYNQQKISFEDYADQKTQLLKDIQRAAEQAADAEIRKLEELKNAYREKMALMNEEMGLQQDLNDLAIAQAEASGASELDIARMKLQQLLEIQSTEKQRLEIQLAQNLASAEDKAHQEQINALLRERLEVQQQVAQAQAQAAIESARQSEMSEASRSASSSSPSASRGGGSSRRQALAGGGGSYESDARDSQREKIEGIKEEMEIRKAAIDQSITGYETIIALRDREIEKIDQAIALLQFKADAARESGNLEEEHAIQQEILRLESEQNIINAEQAVQEAEINRLKSLQAVLAAEAALAEAKANDESAKKIAALKVGLDVAKRQNDLSQKEVEWARENLNATQKLNSERKGALDAAQKKEVADAKSAENTSKIADETGRAKSNTEGMADAMGKVADNAGKAADAVDKAADAAGKSTSTQVMGYQKPDLEAIAQRELELAAQIAEARGDTDKARQLRDEIASEQRTRELEDLQKEARYLQEQRRLYHSERERFIKEQTTMAQSLARTMPGFSVGDANEKVARMVENVYGKDGGIAAGGGKSAQLLNEAMRGFNPNALQQGNKEMQKAMERGNKDVVSELQNVGKKLDKGAARPNNITINGSQDTGADLGKTLSALQRAQR
ncbi:phage tail tape measure protein [Roseofilum capinflatum]|uniref:Phage tail tape measure protein n=1 Tax=Roseofilum capinflatum BLCC-M114 TaxID=3022440 RepID=A0ABT7B6D6_9CYAN|nr:phage tail tape measure protein [Roseofilum capinflatum]MDJ1174701.1 phage tail tape measure protein [Roseofilum capinflatum BLCC-M114]